MFENLHNDFQRYCKIEIDEESPTLFRKIYTGIFAIGFHVTVIYRYGQWLNSSVCLPDFMIPLFRLSYLFCKWIVEKLYDIKIDYSAAIGAGLYIGHFGGIKIRNCIIGNNSSIHQNVVINECKEPANERHLKIGDNVWVGPHAHIIGPISIASHATISAGAIVKNDIPANCLVAGDPARIINNNFDNRELLALSLDP
jgi:serine O-acetyltransferase